jgi:hypothetical protein
LLNAKPSSHPVARGLITADLKILQGPTEFEARDQHVDGTGGTRGRRIAEPAKPVDEPKFRAVEIECQLASKAEAKDSGIFAIRGFGPETGGIGPVDGLTLRVRRQIQAPVRASVTSAHWSKRTNSRGMSSSGKRTVILMASQRPKRFVSSVAGSPPNSTGSAGIDLQSAVRAFAPNGR